jgi:gluconokinase
MTLEKLRSPYAQCGGIYYFARMLDKIRLHAAGELPADYQPNLGGGFDARCTSFLWIEYAPLVERVKQGGSDDDILEWVFSQGRKPSAEEIEIWNEFMRKRGWNDEASERPRTAKSRRRLRQSRGHPDLLRFHRRRRRPLTLRGDNTFPGKEGQATFVGADG